LTELSHAELVRLCAERPSDEAWQEFIRRYQPVIAGTIHRYLSARGPQAMAHAEDLVQRVYQELCSNRCKRLREFTPTHPDSIFGLLKTIAAHTAINLDPILFT